MFKRNFRIQIQVEYIIQNYRRDVNKFSDLNSVKQGKLWLNNLSKLFINYLVQLLYSLLYYFFYIYIFYTD